MAKYTGYDLVHKKRADDVHVIEIDLTDYMDSGENFAGSDLPVATAYDRTSGDDTSADVLDADQDDLDSVDLFYLYVTGGTDGEDHEIEVQWDTDGSPAQTITIVVLLRIRD